MNTSVDIKELNPSIGADIALKKRLYVSGWQLSGDLKWVRNNPVGSKVAIAYKNKDPVGVCLLKSNGLIEVFVKKSERKQGIGRNLVNKLKIEGCWALPGVDREGKIWKKNGIPVEV